MAREPSDDSDRGTGEEHRPVPGPPRPPEAPEPKRRRRRVPRGAVVGACALAIGAGVAATVGIGAGTETKPVEAAALADAVLELRESHERSLAAAMKAPRVLGVKRRKLESIAECESHGDPRATSSDGTYRGKYQFDKGTWRSQGGSGDPAKAPELEQDMRAAILYNAAGSNPWPNCG